MTRNGILVVEDEDKIAAVLCEYLAHAGHAVHRLARGDGVRDWLAAHPVQLVLLDLMLPGLDGLSVCRALRADPAQAELAIIMVTARIEEVDRLLGLDAGADDYICKPFSPREVVARVRAVLRRQAAAPALPATQGLRIDAANGQALLDGQDLGLTVVELRLLQALAAHPGRIFSRDQLMDLMYTDARDVVDRTVDSHVKKLRRKLEAVRAEAVGIQSVYGMGYRLELAPGG